MSNHQNQMTTPSAAESPQADRARAGWRNQTANLDPYQSDLDDALTDLRENRIIPRLWDKDHTIWKPEPEEIADRLGWLDTIAVMREKTERLETFVDSVRAAGFENALLLGMGGSSLAPDLFGRVFPARNGGLGLAVLDSTDPETILTFAEELDPAKTLYLVASKSGTTLETVSLLKFFFQHVANAIGREKAGSHFVAITDPDSELAGLAQEHNFRDRFLNDPHIGGRYSVLSYFGLLPAALTGVDLARLLDRAAEAAAACGPDVPPEENPAARLGLILGELADRGRDKVTFLLPPTLSPFGEWVAQLLAESTGKEGKGILPVVAEPLGLARVYGQDRLFVQLLLVPEADDQQFQAELVEDLVQAEQPMLQLYLHDPYDLGGQFFLWEMATAIAGYRLGINPFDQPNVEAAKTQTRRILDSASEGAEETDEPSRTFDGLTVYGQTSGDDPKAVLDDFLADAEPGDYICLQAYLQPPIAPEYMSREAAEINATLLSLCARMRNEYGLATTLGYGPRYLHSTGQLHKGDAGRGLFVQFTADDNLQLPIPDQVGGAETSLTFSRLIAAQAQGDRQALRQAGRRLIHFHLGSDSAVVLTQINQLFAP